MFSCHARIKLKNVFVNYLSSSGCIDPDKNEFMEYIKILVGGPAIPAQ